MKVSVIVPTYNGANKLGGILNALKKQTYKDFELVVAIDGSTDNSMEVVQGFQDSFNPLKIIQQKNKGRAAIRNFGASQAMGSLLIFFDDDMRPKENCLEQHILHHAKLPGTLMTGEQIDDIDLAITPFQKYKCFLSNKWAEPLRQIEDKALPLEKLHLSAANFSIPKFIFQKLGGFDEQLKDNEDLDLATRAYHKGYDVYYRHSAFAWHDDFHSCKSFIKRQAEYIFYHNYVRINKTEVYSNVPRFSKEPAKLSFFKKLFYSFWGLGWWVTLVDKGLLGWLPQKLQFRMYDWIVYAQLQR